MVDNTNLAIVISIRCLVALVFITAAVGKLRHRTEFSGILRNYQLLPAGLVTPVAYAIPPLEATLSVALIAERQSAMPLLSAMTLLAVFGGAMAINLARGRAEIDCGCFQSHLKQRLRWVLVARNASMIALLGVVAASPGRPASMGDSYNLSCTVTGVAAGAAAFLILQTLNTLWAIPARRRVATGAR